MLTDEDPVIEDPAPATMVTLTGDPATTEKAAPKKAKPPPTSNVQTQPGPSRPRAAQPQPFPSQFIEEEMTYPSGSAPSGPASKFLPEKRVRKTVNYAEDTPVFDDDSDAGVTSGDYDTEDEDLASTEGGGSKGKQPASSAKATGKRPAKRARSSKAAADADVTPGDFDTEDEDPESTEERGSKTKQGKQPALSAKAAGKRPEKRARSSNAAGKQPEKRARSSKAAGKRPEKRALSSTARGKQPAKFARIDNDEDPSDLDQEIGHLMNVNQEEKDLGAEGAQVVISDDESSYDSDVPEFENSVPDPDVLYHQELFAEVKRLHTERLFTRLRMEKTQCLFGPMTQVLDTVSAASCL